MLQVLTRAGYFVAIIFLGFILKKVGIFKDSDFTVLSNIVLKVTLPAVIFTNFANQQLDLSMFVMTLLGLLSGAVYIVLGFLLNLRSSKEQKAFDILNLPGYNIGCFSMPFIQNFLGPAGVITTFLFDIGNGIICQGTAFSIAAMVKNGSKFSVKRLLGTLCKSIPFLMYMIMPIICITGIHIPETITSFVQIIGSANAFLAMFMIGVGFKLTAEKSQIGKIIKIVSVRYAVAAFLALVFYFLLPFSAEIRKALVLLAFSPIGAAVPPFTAELKEDFGLSSAINSICILCSIVLMVIALIVIP